MSIVRAPLFAALALLTTTGGSQLQTGSLTGVVNDEDGSPLAGVTVTLSGGVPDQVQVTEAQGRVRFAELPPGSYRFEG
jgi:hypothetical protein